MLLLNLSNKRANRKSLPPIKAMIMLAVLLLVTGVSYTSPPSQDFIIVNEKYEGWKFRGDCRGLASFTIPDSVKRIGPFAFKRDCDSVLKSITIPNSVTSNHEFAFFMDTLMSIEVVADNQYYSSVNGVLFNKDKTTLIWHPQGRQDTYAVPNGVTAIGKFAFSFQKDLISVAFPNSLITVEEGAFMGCFNLNSITLPNKLTSIGGTAFATCQSLNSITIPSGVTSIGLAAFMDCFGLTSVTILGSVTSIEDRTFYGCTSLTSITIPSTIKSIGNMTFQNCKNLKSITIPNGVTSIGTNAFALCKSLKSITIPNSMVSIGARAFTGCVSLRTIISQNPTPPNFTSKELQMTHMDADSPKVLIPIRDSFEGIDMNAICLYVPKSSIAAYRAADVWKDFKCIKDLASAPKGKSMQ